MMQKSWRFLAAVVILAWAIPVSCPAQTEKFPVRQLTGTVIYLDKTEIRILYEVKDNLHFISGFKMNEATKVKGPLEMGALVTVTFLKERLLRDVYKWTALKVEVIRTAVPEEASQPAPGY